MTFWKLAACFFGLMAAFWLIASGFDYDRSATAMGLANLALFLHCGRAAGWNR